MRARQLIGAKNPLPHFFVVSHLGDISAEIAVGFAVHLYDFEGRSHAAGTKARDNTIALAPGPGQCTDRV